MFPPANYIAVMVLFGYCPVLGWFPLYYTYYNFWCGFDVNRSVKNILIFSVIWNTVGSQRLHTLYISFQFPIVQQFLYMFCPLVHAEVVEPSSLLLPSNWPQACGGPVDWSKNLLPLFVCHSSFAWFRLTVFLASLAQQQARVNSILEPLPMLVLALIVCALSLSLAAFLRFWGFESKHIGSGSPKHYCLFLSLPFFLLLCLFV